MSPGRVLPAVVVMLIASAPVWAQQPPAGEISHFLQASPKPGMVQEFEDAVKGHMAWHRDEADAWAWHVWQFETGPEMAQYVASSFGHRWEDFDAREEFMARDRADAMTRIGPYQASVTAWYSRVRMEISNWPEDLSPRFVHLIMFRVKPNKLADFTFAVERIHKALQEAGWPQHYLWEQVVAGGEGPRFNVVLPMDRWADMEPPDKSLDAVVEEAVGRQEAERLLHTFRETIEGQRAEILRYRPDLSYVPGT